ncbi:MAG: hypothetical protein KAX80_12150 [Planctomycetes bacterium]|nr:hypothetical protein [Planctomycetota bacterium]
MTIPGGYDTGSNLYSGQTQPKYGGGETTPGYQPPAQQASAPTYDPNPGTDYVTARIPQESGFSMAGAGKTIVLGLIIIGLILLLTANIITAAAIKIDFDDSDSAENLLVTVSILKSIGLALLPMGLFYAAISLDDLGTHVRSGLAIAAGLIVGLTGLINLPFY